MSHLIFLDVDGVLNHEDAFVKYKEFGAHVLDPECVRALVFVAAKAEIILTSTWRLHETMNELIRTVLHSHGVRVVGETPFCHGEPRCKEIDAWFANPLGIALPERYLILDDEPDAGKGREDHFVQTNARAGGLTWALAGRAYSVLYQQ